MAKKAAPSSAVSSAPSTAPASTGTITPASTHPIATVTPTTTTKKTNAAPANSWDQIVLNLVDYYQKNTPQRTKLIDVFMAFLVVVGALQFLYCVLAGNYVGDSFLISLVWGLSLHKPIRLRRGILSWFLGHQKGLGIGDYSALGEWNESQFRIVPEVVDMQRYIDTKL